MEFTKQDLTNCSNLLAALKKGNFTLDAMEVLAFAEVIRWVSMLYARIEKDLTLQEEYKRTAVSSVPEAPKILSNKVTKKRE